MAKSTGIKNKGQIIGQIFIFILAGLVFVLIISYGYRAIQHFMERQEQVLLIDFRTDLEIASEGVRRDYGSVRKLELRLPGKFSGFCIFDPIICAETRPVLETSSGKINVDWAQSACELRSSNAFIVPRVMDISLPDIEVSSPGYVCIPNVGGKIVLRLEGTGRKAKVSAWS
ncbi:MAG TPA: hypothetical protein VI612_04200 [Candidatus Nanoarchaeia archaeon]|nr:hypothetical protein [Candidatus Nanoarchaeia archaeon]